MATVSEKLSAYKQEIYKRKLLTGIYAAIIFVATIFLVMLCSGDRFNRYLAYFGLEGISNPAGGVYADCSLPENKDSPYCSRKSDEYQKNWRRLKEGGSAPFTLYK